MGRYPAVEKRHSFMIFFYLIYFALFFSILHQLQIKMFITYNFYGRVCSWFDQ